MLPPEKRGVYADVKRLEREAVPLKSGEQHQ
jgi:hypothetical protein